MTAIRKQALENSNASEQPPRFPSEAYEYNDDVTPAAVEKMRKKASHIIDAEEWEVVDGFVV